MDQPAQYDRYITLLKEFIALPSISTDPQFNNDIKKTAEWLYELLSSHGFEVELVKGFDNPIVLAHFKHNDGKKREHVLIYGHYDVQPAAKNEGWSSDPFTLTEKDGRLIARGAVDNKGQIMIYIAAVLDLIAQNKLTYDVSFLIEGNEETGSDNFESFIRSYKEKIMADFLLVSDGEITAGHPVIEVGFRGVINVALTIETSHKDNHSGLYGGIMPNAPEELSRLLSKLFVTENNEKRIAVEGFYDNIAEPTTEDIAANELIPFDEKEFQAVSGGKTHFSRKGWNIHTQLGFAPSFEITGIQSGYNGIGFRNSIPGSASVKMNMRIVNGQNIKDISEKLEKFVADTLPPYCTYSLTIGDGNPPVRIPSEGPVFEKAIEHLNQIYGCSVIRKYCGATIPIAALFEELLHIPQLYIPMANEDCNMHGADENFEVDLAKKGLQFAINFLSS